MTDRRKRRTRQHVIADIACKHVEYLAAKAGFTTLVSPGGSDYGIDIILTTFDGKGFIENEAVRIQVKARERLKQLQGQRAFSLKIRKEDLSHWLSELSPVILVLFDAATETAYWIYVQQYFSSRPKFLLKRVRGSITVRFDVRQVLDVKAVHAFAEYKRSAIKQLQGLIQYA